MSKCIIQVSKLNHTYCSFEAKSGFFNNVKDFFKRKKIYTHALKDITLEIREGEIVGLLGPNGAGKTTLLKILSGLIYPSVGSVLVMNTNPYNKEKAFLKDIGVVMGQKSQLLWDIPPLDSLQIIAEIYGIKKQEFHLRLTQFTDLLSIGHRLHNPVRHLSLGERMKFELIASLIHQPKLLFLDEPTIGLDIVSQKAIRDFLKFINKTHRTTIIVTSHYLKDIEILANKLIIIRNGSIFYNDSLSALLKNFNELDKVYFSTLSDQFDLSFSVQKISPEQFCVTCEPIDLKRILLEIIEKVPKLTHIKTETISFEEAIFSIFEEREKST